MGCFWGVSGQGGPVDAGVVEGTVVLVPAAALEHEVAAHGAARHVWGRQKGGGASGAGPRPQNGPKMAQNGPKNGPGQPRHRGGDQQEGREERVKKVWGGFWGFKGKGGGFIPSDSKRPQNGSKIAQNGLKMAPKWLRNGLGMASKWRLGEDGGEANLEHFGRFEEDFGDKRGRE